MASRLPLVFLVCFAPITSATELVGTLEFDGQPVANAVVSAVALEAPPAPKPSLQAQSMLLDQKSREFVPHVLAVHRGTPVYFPNSDDIKHHVYSFSAAKPFELKLYSGMPLKPVLFDQSGVVVIGCNIHDWMLGYVFVSDADYLSQSDVSGRWSLNLPNGHYRLSIWHPDAVVQPAEQIVQVPAPSLQQQIELKPNPPTGKPPDSLQIQGYGDGF